MLIGFSYKQPDDVYSKHKIVFLDFERSNPYTTYEESDKNSMFVVKGLLPIQFIMSKKQTNKLKGNFVVLDIPRNLSENKIKCLDCVYKSGMSMRTQYEGDIDNLMEKDCVTKFPKKLHTIYVKDKLYKEVSTKLLKLKHIHKEKELTFNNVVDSFLASCKKHKVNLDKSKEYLARAITNNVAYEELIKLGDFANKYIPKIKRICSKGDMSKSIIAFQDMMYFLTDRETAISEDIGNEEVVNRLLEMWNPNPTKKKEVVFKFNKKPLPKNIHISKKKKKKWEEQEHIIPPYICVRRKKHQKSLFSPKCIGFTDIKIPTIEKGEYTEKQICKILNISKCKVYGGHKDDKIIFRKGEIVSVINQENNSFHYLRVV